MYLEITNYVFKSAEDKSKGLSYIKGILTPYESDKKGYINTIISESDESDIIVMNRFEIKQNSVGSGIDRDGYKAFAALWSRTPDVVAGSNRANKEFQYAEAVSA